MADRVGNTDLPGVRSIVERVAGGDSAITPEALVDRCLEMIGPIEVSDDTRTELVTHAEEMKAPSHGAQETNTRSLRGA